MEFLKKQTELILRKGENKFEGKTTAKNMRGWLKGRICKYSKSNDLELRMVFEGILNAYNHFHPKIELEVPIDSWKGKSSFQILDNLDEIVIIKYQKPKKGEEPKRIENRISKDEVKTLINCIKKLSEKLYDKKIPTIETKYLAMAYSRALDLGHNGWKEFFSDRNNHNKLTLMLGALDKLNLINYSGGKTTWLNNKLSFQKSLDDLITKK